LVARKHLGTGNNFQVAGCGVLRLKINEIKVQQNADLEMTPGKILDMRFMSQS